MAACGRPNTTGVDSDSSHPIAAAEAARPHTGNTVSANLTAAPADIDLGGPVARTLAYNNQVPGPLIRAGGVGDELSVRFINRLDHASSVHWHGIALRNDMDGAAPATPDISPGGGFTYRFISPPYAAHTGASPPHRLDATSALPAGDHR